MRYVTAILRDGNVDDISAYDRFCRYLYWNAAQLNPIFCEHSDHNEKTIFVIFNVDKLVFCEKFFETDSEVLEIITKLKLGKTHTCCRCGSLILGYYPFTYRGCGGCVSKYTECVLCSDFSDVTAHEVSDIYRKKSSEDAIKYLMSIL